MNVLYVGDLHLGNIYSDVKSFFELMERVKTKHRDIHEIIFTGDVVDGLDKYETQKYKQYPETLEVQYKLLKLLLYYLEHEFPETRVVLVLGNHDKYFHGLLFDKELIESRFSNVRIVEKYIDSNSFLCIHELGGKTGGDVGWTPTMLQRAKTLLLAEGTKLKGLVTAHIHKSLSIVKHGGQMFIVLPAFLMHEREIARNVTFNPSVVLVDANDGSETVEIYEKEFNDIDEVKEANDRLVTCVRRDYTKCLGIIDDLLSAKLDSEDIICVRYGQRKRCFGQDLLDKVRKLLKEGLSKEEISRVLGVSKPTVYAMLKYLGEVE